MASTALAARLSPLLGADTSAQKGENPIRSENAKTGTADWLLTRTRTDPNSRNAGGVSAFIVERDSPGLTVGKPDRKMGQRGAQTADVAFDNVLVPAENVIGGVEGMGFKTAMKVLDKARVIIAAVCIGAATRRN